MKIVTGKVVAGQIVVEGTPFEHRLSAPDAVAEEFERSFALLSIEPRIGAVARSAKLSGVRRIHLARIHHHLYYRVVGGFVEIPAVWHGSRGSGPSI